MPSAYACEVTDVWKVRPSSGSPQSRQPRRQAQRPWAGTERQEQGQGQSAFRDKNPLKAPTAIARCQCACQEPVLLAICVLMCVVSVCVVSVPLADL